MTKNTTIDDQLCTPVMDLAGTWYDAMEKQLQLQISDEALAQTFTLADTVYELMWERVGLRLFWHLDDHFEKQSGVP